MSGDILIDTRQYQLSTNLQHPGIQVHKKGVSGDILIDDDSISSARTSSTLGYRYIRRV